MGYCTAELLISQGSNKMIFVSLNVNGMGSNIKRRMIFKLLHRYKNSIICLQETHLKSSQLNWYSGLWGGKICMAGESSQAGGLITMLSPNTVWSMTPLYADRLGHFLICRVTDGDLSLIVINVYLPTADREQAQLQTLRNLEGVLSSYAGENMVVMGDFNVCFHSDLDRYNHTPGDIRNGQTRSKLSALLEAYSLLDVWRVQHPGEKGFTWYRCSKASRLDYIFLSEHLLGRVSKSKIADVACSDHRLVLVSLGEALPNRGRGFWRLNSSLLDNPRVFEDIVRLVTEKKALYKDLDHMLRWEMLKFDLQALFRGWSVKIDGDRNRMMTDLKAQIQQLAEANDLSPAEVETLHNLRRELYALQTARENKAFFRSRCSWAMYGGKCSKFFLNLEKKEYENKVISLLVDDQDTVLTEPGDILNYERDQFCKRYAKTVVGAHLPDPYSSALTGSLDDQQREELDGELTVEELEAAVKAMGNNKSPGSDGLTAEFYKRCWFLVSDWLLDCYREAFRRGALTPNQKRGVITLIPKKGKDKRRLENWRPITLLNLDYKILAKAIDNRLSGVIAKFIHINQTGFMAGRFIGTNLRNISDIISYLQATEGGLVTSLDYAMAFDTLDRDFLYKSLHSLGFGETILGWIRLMYSGAEACILNNGHSSGWFMLESGLRQGCPASPHLFVLAVESTAQYLVFHWQVRNINSRSTQMT